MMKKLILLVCSAFCCHRAVTAEGAASFTAGPSVKRAKDGVRIEFTVSKPTDVAVEILNARGETVRHLVAGVLGSNAPEPLAKNSLKQSILWDRRDDLEKRIPPGSYSVRVGLTLTPRLKKLENFEPLSFGVVSGVTALAGGGACINGDRLPRLVVVNPKGEYVRQVYPPPANLDPATSPGLPTWKRADGRWAPGPLGGVIRRAEPLASPMACGGGRIFNYQSGSQEINVLDPKTGAVLKPLSLKALGKARPLTKLIVGSMAVSPDGKWLYATGTARVRLGKYRKRNYPRHAVYRLSTVSGGENPGIFAGQAEKSGGGNLLSSPGGLAVDAKGNLYVCDRGNDRIAVFSPGGKRLRVLEVKSPLRVTVRPDGLVVALCSGGKKRPKVLRLLGPKGALRASLDVRTPRNVGRAHINGMSLDASAKPAMLWISVGGRNYPVLAGAVLRYECTATGFRMLEPVVTNYRRKHVKGPYSPRYLANWGGSSYIPYTEAFDWKYLTDEGTPFYSMGPLERKGRWNNPQGRWADGRIYCWQKSWSWWKMKKDQIGLKRFSADGKPVPFTAGREGLLRIPYPPASPWHHHRGTMVDRRGHVYVRYSYDLADGKATKLHRHDRNRWMTGIIHFDAAGRKVGEIHLTHATSGMGVDARGNIYVGDKPRPPGALVPEDIEKGFRGEVPHEITNWYGSVVKFGPKGGGYKFTRGTPQPSDRVRRTRGNLFAPLPRLLDADYCPFSSKRSVARLEGAKWMHVGMSPMVSTRGCICIWSSLAVDPHGRVYFPDKWGRRITVLDTAGNLLRYIGSYGNMDSRGPSAVLKAGKNGRVPGPEIAFCQLKMVTSATSRQVRAADTGNGWVSVVNLGYAAEKRLPVSVSGN
jgi:hypothetical protein